MVNHFRGGHSKGSAKPKGDPEEEKETEDEVPLAQRPSGSGGQQLLEAPGFGYTASPTRSPSCCLGGLGKVKTEASTLGRTKLL